MWHIFSHDRQQRWRLVIQFVPFLYPDLNQESGLRDDSDFLICNIIHFSKQT